MYSYDNIKEIEKEFKRFLLLFLSGTLIFIAIVVVTCKNWGTAIDPVRLPVWPCYVIGCIYAIASVFTWNMIGIKMIRYRNFVYNIITGLEHSLKGVVEKIGTSIESDKDIEYYYVEIKEEDETENRMLHLDAEKDISFLEVGKTVNLKVFGNYIKEIV